MPLDDSDKKWIVEQIAGASGKTKDGKFTLDDVVVALQHLGRQSRAKLDELEKRLVASPNPSEDRRLDPGDKKPVDLEKMSRADFAKYIKNEFSGELKSMLDPIIRGISEVKGDVGRSRLELDVADAEERFDDLWEYEDEIKEVMKAHRDLSVDEAYHLAKGRNPEKVKEVEKKKAEIMDKQAKEREEKEMSEFLGFTPTSGRYGPKKDMTIDDAAEAAWKGGIEGSPAEKLLSVN